jgi:hypothetical protein
MLRNGVINCGDCRGMGALDASQKSHLTIACTEVADRPFLPWSITFRYHGDAYRYLEY